MQRVHTYDHRVHAGNAGDVWKHFVLAEVASCQLVQKSCLIYAESHVGRPEYLLDNRLGRQSEWTKGIGRCWRHLPALQNFCYFKVLANLNPQGLRRYPGSALLVQETTRMHGSKLHAEVWDVDSDVAAAWAARQDLSGVRFHLGDGFAGIRSLLDRSPPGLLLIDPPYINPEDSKLAEDLLCTAAEKGWIVLWWYMLGGKTIPEVSNIQSLSLDFADAGMDGGRWQGAVVTIAGASDSLIEHLREQAATLQRVIQSA